LILYNLKSEINEGFQNTKAMIIVEPRAHPLLESVIKNFDENMDISWDLYVFHGKSSGEYATNATKTVRRNLYLIPLETDNLTADEYNILFKSPDFWSKINAENILVFQTDSALCKNSKLRIERFMKYDYIGCPVDDKGIGKGGFSRYWGNESFYGIGGLSFRKKSFMLSCIQKYPNVSLTQAEDIFYGNCLEHSDNKVESAKVMTEFCTQHTLYDYTSFGVHKTNIDLERWSFIRPIRMKKLYTMCPEAKMLEDA